MDRGNGVDTVPAPGDKTGWWNEADGKVLSKHSTKKEAVAAGRAAAKVLKTEHHIHNEDGKIREKNSYGNDAFPPRG
jgi:hypothetical protein